jgi:hypothetical protein
MRIRITYKILLIYISTLKGFAFQAGIGSTLSFPVSSLPDSYNESYVLVTDRNMYAISEKILFSAFNTSPPAIRDACWSRVLYVHLVKPDGTSVAQGKFSLECHGASSGFLDIPDEILTGNYYLCAYTKWMRNFSPALFSFVPLKIINPFSPQLDRLSLSGENRIHPPDSLYPEMTPYPGETPESGNAAIQMLECKPDKVIYRPGEEIQLSIHYPGGGTEEGHICLSVASEGLLDTMIQCENHPMVDASWTKPDPGYLPEINGLSLSGRILAGDPPEGIENARVEMAIFGNYQRILAYKTNPDGSFYYCLDSFAGSHESGAYDFRIAYR